MMRKMQKSKTNRPTQAEQASTRLALFIAFNAMIVHEALATLGSADPLSLRPRSGPTVRDWLVKQWKNIQTNINYEPVFQISASILERLPAHPVIERTLNRLAGIASGIVA